MRRRHDGKWRHRCYGHRWGREYWASRLNGCGGDEPGRWTKVQTHRKERRVSRAIALDEAEDMSMEAR